MLVVDSAGVQSTVSYRSQAVDAIHDAQTTESLMFEMVSRISHQMIFVVNDLYNLVRAEVCGHAPPEVRPVQGAQGVDRGAQPSDY